MPVQPVITLGDIVLLTSILACGLAAFYSLRGDVRVLANEIADLKKKVNGHAGKLEEHGESLARLEAITELKFQ